MGSPHCRFDFGDWEEALRLEKVVALESQKTVIDKVWYAVGRHFELTGVLWLLFKVQVDMCFTAWIERRVAMWTSGITIEILIHGQFCSAMTA